MKKLSSMDEKEVEIYYDNLRLFDEEQQTLREHLNKFILKYNDYKDNEKVEMALNALRVVLEAHSWKSKNHDNYNYTSSYDSDNY